MADVNVVTQTDYYSIDNSLAFHKHSTFEGAKNNPDVKFIVKQLIGHNPFETSNYGVIKNYASSLHLLTESGIEYDSITENDWELKIDTFGLTYGYAYNTMWIKFTDSFGYTERETFGISIMAFIEAYKRFQLLNNYKGYKLAVVSLENSRLKMENQELKQQVKGLIADTNVLRNQLSQMA